MSIFKVISTGSKGNAVLYHGSILVDIGIPFSVIKQYLQNVQIVLLTHRHLDHINIRTLERMCEERPGLRIGCPEWMVGHVNHIKEPDKYEMGNVYSYGDFTTSPIKLYHDSDAPNCGYRIFKDGYEILHATDTFTMEGIEAKNYDLYALEHNHDEEAIKNAIKIKTESGQFVYENRSLNTHLSEQKAREWLRQNKGPNSEVIRLHQSENY